MVLNEIMEYAIFFTAGYHLWVVFGWWLSTGAGKYGTHLVMVMEGIINGHRKQLLLAIFEMTKLTSVFEFLGTCRKN